MMQGIENVKVVALLLCIASGLSPISCNGSLDAIYVTMYTVRVHACSGVRDMQSACHTWRPMKLDLDACARYSCTCDMHAFEYKIRPSNAAYMCIIVTRLTRIYTCIHVSYAHSCVNALIIYVSALNMHACEGCHNV